MPRNAAARLLLAAVAIAVVAAGAWWFWEPAAQEEVSWADPGDARLVALGQAVYAESCASCHGAELEGEPDWRVRRPDGRLPAPPHDETGHTWHHPDMQLFEITRYGVEHFAPAGYQSDMPAFEGLLTDEEIWAVLAFIKSRWPERERAFQERRNRLEHEARE